MKKLLLLLMSCSIGLGVTAQERQLNALSTTQEEYFVKRKNVRLSKEEMYHNGQSVAHKTTSGGSRWYNYFGYLDTTAVLNGYTGATNTEVLMWQDTNQIYQFTGTTPGFAHINMCSVGSIFDPSSQAYNDSEYYVGEIRVGSSDTYVIDSVTLFGVYNFNPAKAAIVDTLRLSFVKGKGLSSDDVFSGYHIVGGHYDNDKFLEMHYDSILNIAHSGTAIGTPSSNMQDIILTSASWADTNTNGIWVKTIGLTTPLSMPTNGIAGVSISFKTGDILPTSLPGDTILYANGHNKFNEWDPLVSYASNATGVAQWPIYDVADSNVGMFRRLYVSGWSKVWLPTWAWSTNNGTAASSLQYPNVSWHVTCTSCATITNNPSGIKNVIADAKISAYPNPANNDLTVSYDMPSTTDITVSLTNVFGQQVAAQTQPNALNGKVTFNTAQLPEGIYLYTVNADGKHTTGRVTITH